MKLAGLLVLSLVATGSAFAQNRDACVPPPTGFAPALPAKMLAGQGTEFIKFPITTKSPEAQKFFLQGVAQMHSFWAIEAERSFRQAAELDPEAPMPWWGVAMVAAGDYRPRFQLDNYTELNGLSALRRPVQRAIDAAKRAQQLAQTPGKATDLEKMYIASVVARRIANDSDEAYVQALRSLVAKYPKEVEARSYLALHIMRGFTSPDKKPKLTSMESVEILRALLKDAPDHPGAHHYVIHGWEGSTFAKDAWDSCKRYAELVPNIPHALHMPGHIYAQTGRWDDAVKSFSDAAQNELTWIKADKLYGTGHHGHNVHFQATAESFSAKFEDARKSAAHLLEFPESPAEAAQVDNYRSAKRQGWFAMLRTLMQAEAWDLILDGKTLPEYPRPRERAWRAWATAVALAHVGQLDAARAQAKVMEEQTEELVRTMKMKTPDVLAIAREELEGHISAGTGDVKKALAIFASASQKERAITYNEPPSYPRPVAEAAGSTALRAGKIAEAERAFRVALEQYPEDSIARKGLAEAARRRESGGE
jgi:tetratricopeptide (TPR) repeat protein